MNGRMYDPVLGRFLGVDPVIQDGTFSQSFNGYSYCMNNPLGIIDPSGKVMIAISPQNFSSFISSVLSTINTIGEIASWYEGQEWYEDNVFLTQFANKYGKPGGNGGYLFENENAGHTYLWMLSGFGEGVETSGYYTNKGLFVLPTKGYGYPNTPNATTMFNNTFKEARDEFYEYRWENGKYFLLDPLGLGTLQIFGHVHVHPWNKKLDDPKNPPDEGFSPYWKLDYGYARDILKGLPMVLMNWDGKVFGTYYDKNIDNCRPIPEFKSLTVPGIMNRFNGDKVMPIILKYQF